MVDYDAERRVDFTRLIGVDCVDGVAREEEEQEEKLFHQTNTT